MQSCEASLRFYYDMIMMSMQISKKLYPTVISRQLRCVEKRNGQRNIVLIWEFDKKP